IAMRPSAPPEVTFGNGTDIDVDPHLRLKMKQAAFDLYVFSFDRFVRFFTVTMDLDVPVNLVVSPSGLLPTLKIKTMNAAGSNGALLGSDQTVLDDFAKSVAGLIGSALGSQIGSGSAPINVNTVLAAAGLELVIPDTVDGQGTPGLRKLSKGTDAFFGLFAAF